MRYSGPAALAATGLFIAAEKRDEN